MVTDEKAPFNINTVIGRIREAVRPLPKAVMFELAEEGYNSAFEQLMACVISQRTREEVTAPAARRLFKSARSPEEILQYDTEYIDRLISPSTYHETKAQQIHEIARTIVESYGGDLPCDYDMLTSLRGIGPKCANLILGIACDQQRIGVDVHVHRVTNRWGYVHTSTPEDTTKALERILPERYWVEINRLLVPFGKYVCTGDLPKCSTCPVLDMCRQVGVSKHR